MRSEGDRLSDRETEVVRLIARGFSNKEIASRLQINARTVETYKARSLEKLGLKTRADLRPVRPPTRLAAEGKRPPLPLIA